MHKHYLLPLEFAADFLKMEGSNRQGIDVEDFAIGVDMAELTTFPNYESFAAAWLGSWKPFFEQNTGKAITQKQAFVYCEKLTKLFGLKGKAQ